MRGVSLGALKGYMESISAYSRGTWNQFPRIQVHSTYIESVSAYYQKTRLLTDSTSGVSMNFVRLS